ncbi:hypothetical protein CCACVL1_06050 [Corchorus capsularis]|uniref:Uncharacterized protein n=1 Tax=Corchorus capsularis TaxID=210143 RepID=A0A1R3JHW7_COCAP|nr:hypothetical protein CCACVL1_06050 [Corchorus capsularis]
MELYKKFTSRSTVTLPASACPITPALLPKLAPQKNHPLVT